MHTKLCIALFCAGVWLPHAALAQRPPAADPAAASLPFKYESAFSGYRAYQDEALRNWAEVNEEVAKAGGHVGIFREAARAAGGAPAGPPGEGQPPVRGAPEAPAGKVHH